MHLGHVCIVGSGFMGHGIGQEWALSGAQVTLYDVEPGRLDVALRNIARSLHELADWGIIESAAIDHSMARLAASTDIAEAARPADLVIEAVSEDLNVKRQVFGQLDAICRPDTILATNSSSLTPSQLAETTCRPERVLGIHYFYPVPLMPVVEVVPGEKTHPGIVQTVMERLEAMGKSPVLIHKESPGYIANRLQFALQREALALVEEGVATAQDIDRAVRDGFGRRLAYAGPFEIAEPIGWDLELKIQSYLFPHLSAATEPSPLLHEKVREGELGVKTGKGFYEWTPEKADAWRKAMAEALALRMSRRP